LIRVHVADSEAVSRRLKAVTDSEGVEHSSKVVGVYDVSHSESSKM